MERRDFLKYSGIISLTALIPTWVLESCKKTKMMAMESVPIYVEEGDFTTLLTLLPLITSGNIILNAKQTSSKIIGDTNSRVFGFHDSILGPIIKINSGQTVTITFNNQLADKTNIHWHGVIVPPDMDGHPENLINSGSGFNYTLPITQRAGTSWYHPHPHGDTANQVFMGLASMFIINDTEEQALNLPSGDYELPLIIQDKRIYPDYSLNYSPALSEIGTGYMGQYITVNGINSSYYNVSTKFYRLRILNACNARILNFALSNNANFYIIGSDGGLLANPQTVNSVLLASGERLDILVDFTSYSVGTEVFLQSNTFSGASDVQGVQQFKVLKFIVTQSVLETFTIPSALSVITPLPAATLTRSFEISNSTTGGSAGGGHQGHTMGGKMIHKINDKSFDMERIDETVSQGAIENWVFSNENGEDPHPMHIHGVMFQVVERTGGRNMILPHETGWKDTVLVLPKERVKVLVQFTNSAGKYVFHCHNLEHEDSGMMLNYKIQ